MRSPFPPSGWVLLLGLLAACGDDRVISICISDLDCEQGSCVNGACALPPQPPLPDWTPVGPDCEAPCGYLCCPEGQHCRHGACVADCQSGVWCGSTGAEVCCAQREVCSGDRTCVTPPPPPPECEEGVWDLDFGGCVSQVTPRHCEKPTVAWEPEVLWHATPTDGFDQVIVTPLVVDLDADGIPEVIAPFHSRDTQVEGPAVLRALSGLDGSELWRVEATQDGPTGVAQPAAAVLGDYEGVTVLVMDAFFRLRAYDGATGAFKWFSRDAQGQPVQCDVGWGAPQVADL